MVCYYDRIDASCFQEGTFNYSFIISFMSNALSLMPCSLDYHQMTPDTPITATIVDECLHSSQYYDYYGTPTASLRLLLDEGGSKPI